MDAIILRYVFVMLVLALTKQVSATKFLSRGFVHQDPPFVKLSGLSWDECLSKCQRRFSCKSVIFRRHIQSCRLYDRLSSGISGEPTPGTVYGLPTWRNTREYANTTCNQHECNEVDCGSIPTVDNAFSVGNNTTFGSNVTYMCNSGYIHNDGSDITFCSRHGQWTPTTIACTPIDCGQPNVTSRVVTESGSTFYGTIRTISCADGYESDTSELRESALACQSNGTWSETKFACELNLTGIGDFGNFRSDFLFVQSEIVHEIYGEANFTDVTLYDCAEKCRAVPNYCIAINYNTEKSTCTLADRILQRLLQTATGWDILYKKVGVYFTHGPNGWYTLEYQSAVDYCVQAGSAIAPKSDIELAFNKGLNVDQCGWIEEGYAVIMLHHPVPGIYLTTGINACTWSNKWGVYCKSSSLPPL